MNTLHMLVMLTLTEVRLRLRRWSTILTLFGIVAIAWLIIVDPKSGQSMLSSDKALILNNSAALAIGSASLISPLFGLIGFYLARGRMAEDMRTGVGGIIASTRIGNMNFLFSRWLGGVAYLVLLAFVFCCSIFALHILRGQGSIELLVYAKTYALILLPMIIFAVSSATFFDSFSLLMGKAGDVLYFLAWAIQIVLMENFDKSVARELSFFTVFDFTGTAASVFSISSQFSSQSISIGSSTYDPNLPALTYVSYWPSTLILFRCTTSILALLPILPAVFLFHRFSPDKVKLSKAQKRHSPLEVLNNFSRPLAKRVQALFKLATVLPGPSGQVVSEVALTLIISPFSILALALFSAIAGLVEQTGLFGVLNCAIVYWGILISDVSTRDFQSGLEAISGAVKGGTNLRYLRQFAATFVLGLMFSGIILLRWLTVEPAFALVLVVGLLCLSAMATTLGRCSHTPRLFMVLFLFWIYVCGQVPKLSIIDAVGFNGVADKNTILWQVAIGGTAFVFSYIYNQYKSR